MTTRELIIDQLNNLTVQIEVLNARMDAMEAIGRAEAAEYEALSALEWDLCVARTNARKRLRTV